MKMRDWLNKNSALVTIGAVLLLIGALVAIILQMRGPGVGKPIDMYYYDLKSDKTDHKERLFIGKSNEIPPIEAPSKGKMADNSEAGVRAWVFACGDCGDKDGQFIGYLEMFTAKAREMRMNPPAPDEQGRPPMDNMMEMEQGHLIASIDNLNRWVPQNSPEGTMIIQQVQTKCGTEPPKTCYPD